MAELHTSVLIPAYNAERWLSEAIESVLSQRQWHEIVVIDDGSQDATPDIARRYAPAVRLLRQAHGGTGVARNFGLTAVEAELVAFLDADDRFTATGLDLRVEYLRDHPDCDLVFGRSRHFQATENGQPVPCGPPQACELPGAAVIRRHALGRIGRFRESVVADGLDWLLRSRELGIPEVTLPDHVMWRRVHPGNSTSPGQVDYREYARALKESLDRRRAAAGAHLPAG